MKKAGAKLRFAAQPFCFAEYVLAERGTRNTVTSASLYDGFFGLCEDVTRFYAAAVVTDACDKLALEGMQSGPLLVAAVSALEGLCADDELALVRFLLAALAFAGYPVEAGECPACGKRLRAGCGFPLRTGRSLRRLSSRRRACQREHVCGDPRRAGDGGGNVGRHCACIAAFGRVFCAAGGNGACYAHGISAAGALQRLKQLDFFTQNSYTCNSLKNTDRANRIREKKEKMGQPIDRGDALVLAHYYAPDAVQAAADFVGDSFALAQRAVKSDKPVIVFCGVSFMGESAKILCPEKTVYLPAPDAHCPMADMATEEEILHMRATVEDLAVVVYVNSSARLKAFADVVVTSANAVKVVSRLKEKNIYFIPDKNLGAFVAAQLPEKKFYFGHGCCPIHNATSAKEVRAALGASSFGGGARSCGVPRRGAYHVRVWSVPRAGMIAYAEKSSAQEF